MARCKICDGEMLEHVGCKIETCKCEGIVYPRIKFGAEEEHEGFFGAGDICPDCFAPFGSFHHYACDMEVCPVCGNIIYGNCKCDLSFSDLKDTVDK